MCRIGNTELSNQSNIIKKNQGKNNKMSQQPPVNADDLKSLKERMNLIAAADPNQKLNEFALIRYLRAFKDVDGAFKVKILSNIFFDFFSLTNFLLAVIKATNVWVFV